MIKKLEALIKMQKLDTEIGKLEKRIEILPKKLSSLKTDLEFADVALKNSENLLKENIVEQKNSELTIQQHKDKIGKFKNQLLGIKNNKEYKALNSEITFLENEIEKIDDSVLELMEESDNITNKIKQNKKDKIDAEKNLEANENKLKEEIAKVQAQITLLRDKRKEFSKDLDRATLKRYVALIKSRDRKAVADDYQDACSGCGFKIRPQLKIDLRKGTKIHSCEYCGRFLVSKENFDEVEVDL